MALGTATGIHVRQVLEKVKPDRPYWLLDSWDGRRSASDPSIEYPESTDFDSVRRSFAAWPNVRFLRGIIPASLSHLPADPIAFAYFCLGDTEAEIAAFEMLLPRLSPGGIFVLNGFGRKRTSNAQRKQFIDLAARHSNELLILPTAHAILFA